MILPRFACFITALVLLQAVGLRAAKAQDESPPRAESYTCLKEGKRSSATRNGRFYFIVRRSPTDVPSRHQTGPVIALAPDDLAQPEAMCDSTFLSTGIFYVESIEVRIKGGPYYSGRSVEIGRPGTNFIATISFMAPDALRRRMQMGLESHSWLPMGREFGLQKYQQVVGLKDGRLTNYSLYLGPYLVGTSKAGHFVMIDCLDVDYSKIIACQLRIAVRDETMIAIVLPTENIKEWARYASAAELFFEDHLQK